MLEYDWEDSVGHWVCTASHALRKALGAKLVHEGLTLRQWEVLAWLSCKGCGSQSELAEYLGIEPHTLAGIVSRMERDELLERRACEHDRRKNTIQPTQKAEDLWARVAAMCRDIRRQAIRDISPADLTTFRTVCERIHKNLGDNEAADPVRTSRTRKLPRPGTIPAPH